jgi:type II secretory pathway pseudopilin PulG
MIGFIKFLVVVAIFGFLAVVLIPNIGNFIGVGKSQTVSTQIKSVQTAATTCLQRTMETCEQLLASR